MNKFITTDNGGLPILLDDLRFIDDSVRNALKGLISAYGIPADKSFILSGAGSTLNGPNYDIAAGYICLDGEVLEVLPHSITTTLTGNEKHIWKLKTSFDPAGLKTFESTSSFDTYQIRTAEVVVEDPLAAPFMPMVAPTIYQRFAAEGFGTILQTKVLQIGGWDMDTDVFVNVAHGLADFKKIRDISVIIRDDADGSYSELNLIFATGDLGGGWAVNSSNVILSRVTGGGYDGASYNDDSFNRGFVTIQYEL